MSIAIDRDSDAEKRRVECDGARVLRVKWRSIWANLLPRKVYPGNYLEFDVPSFNGQFHTISSVTFRFEDTDRLYCVLGFFISKKIYLNRSW